MRTNVIIGPNRKNVIGTPGALHFIKLVFIKPKVKLSRQQAVQINTLGFKFLPKQPYVNIYLDCFITIPRLGHLKNAGQSLPTILFALMSYLLKKEKERKKSDIPEIRVNLRLVRPDLARNLRQPASFCGPPAR